MILCVNELRKEELPQRGEELNIPQKIKRKLKLSLYCEVKKKKELMKKRKKVALCSSKNSIYDDICLEPNKYIYSADNDGQNAEKISIGAHYYYREKEGSFIYRGIVSDIDKKENMYTLKKKRSQIKLATNFYEKKKQKKKRN